MKVEHSELQSGEVLLDQFIAINHLTKLRNFLVTGIYEKCWEKGLVISLGNSRVFFNRIQKAKKNLASFI